MRQNEEVKLLPCPFCKSKDLDPEGCVVEYAGQDGLAVVCGGCDANGPAAADAWMAAYRWNQRG